MGKGRVVGGAVALVLLASVGLLLWLVMQDGAGPLPPADSPGAADGARDEQPAADAGGGGRRHATREGTAALHGRVVRGKVEAPFEGAGVRLLREGFPDWTAASGADGSFRFEKLPEGGPYTVAVDAADCAPVRLPGLGLERHDDLDVGTLRLDRAVAVTVQVRSLDDTPIAGARVEAFASAPVRWESDWTKRLVQIGIEPVAVAALVTDAAGEVHFDALATGTWTFRATKAGFARGGRPGAVLSADDPSRPVVIRLQPGHTVSGVVRDADTGPLAGALVLAMRPGDAWSPQNSALYGRATSGADGAYELQGLEEGVVAIWAARAGSIPSQRALLKVPEIASFDLELRSGAVLTGLVTDVADGTPVADVEVRAVCYESNQQSVGAATTDAEGRYTITDLPEAMLNTVSVDRPGWVVQPDDGKQVWLQLALPHGETVTHDIRLRRAADLVGVVRGPDGPLADANVNFYHQQPGGGFGSRSATTDATGRFRLQGVYEGKGIVQIRASGHFQRDFPEQYWQELQNGTVPEAWGVEMPTTGTVEKEFLLERCARLSGTVYGADGAPLAGAQVTSWSSSASTKTTTAADGTYALDGVAAGSTASVNVSAEGHCGDSRSIERGDGSAQSGVDFHLVATKHVRGTVRSADGAPLQAAWVQVVAAPQPPPQDQPWQWQDPDHRFDRFGKEPVRADGSFDVELRSKVGKFVVRAGAAGGTPTMSQPFDVDESRAEYDVDVTLRDALTVTGRVVADATGDPVVGAHVGFGRRHPMADTQPWYDQNNPTPIVAVTDADGRFVARADADGAYKLTADATGFVQARARVDVPRAGDVDLRLKAQCVIAGRVHLADGSPVQGAQVTYERVGASGEQPMMQQPALTGTNGAFRLSDLAPGRYTLHVASGWASKVNIRPLAMPSVEAGREDLDVTVEAGLVISGRIIDDTGAGVGEIWVQCQRENAESDPDQWTGAQTAHDGAFEIVGLRDGTHTLGFTDNGQRGFAGDQRKGVAAGTTGLVVRLTKGLEIEGVLVDEQGAPVAGQQLYAQLLNESGQVEQTQYGFPSASTDSKGAFVLRGLVQGSYTIQRGWNGSANDARVLLGGERVAAGTRGLRVTLGKGGAIAGVIVDEAGNAVSGEQMVVGARPEDGGGTERWGQVQSGGSFRVEGLTTGVRYVLRTRGGGYAPGKSDPVDPGTEGVRIVVHEGLAASGVLVDTRGAGISGATVMLQGDDNVWAWAQTDESGAFTVKGLEPGSHKASAWLPGADGQRNQRNVQLGSVEAGSSGLRLEAPDAE